MKKFRCALLTEETFDLRLMMRPAIRICGCALLLCLLAAISLAQAPGWSRGQQNLAITYDECGRRASLALQAEGYRIDYATGGFTVGIKDIHTAVITCNTAPENRIWVNVVVASNGGGGGEQRQRLQAQMDRPNDGQARGCGLGARWRVTDGGWNGIWTRRGNSDVFDAVWNKDGQQFTATLTIRIEGNRVNVKRRNATLGGDCELNGTLGEDGVTITGTNVCTQGRGDVRAVIECGR